MEEPVAPLETRADFERELFSYLAPLLPHYSALGARLNLAGGGAQYETEVISMEAWARPLWGLAPFWAGGGRSAGGVFEDLYRRGLIVGTDPASAEYWGDCRDHDQKFVEMAALAYALLLAPEVLWEPLDEAERARVATWLSKINEHACPAGNWLWFQVLVNLALRALGCAFSGELIARSLVELDSFYEGNGWYADGPTGLPDYYNAMTFHFFSLLYVRLFADTDPTRAETYRTRAALFAADYVKLFSARGESVPYGRSLAYRFAHAGFWSMVVAAGVDVGNGFGLGTVKGLVARNLRAWSAREISDNGGVLSIGYHYPNLHMAESYNAAGSPYWCLMAFACLALPASHDFWRTSADPLPETGERGQSSIRHALGGTALVQRDAAGEVFLYPNGRVPGHPFAQSDCKYSKFAYSSRFGFSVARSTRSLEEAAPDSMLAFVIDGRVLVRDGVESWAIAKTEEGPAVVASWNPCSGVHVETTIVPKPWGHIRRHRIVSSVVCEAYDCGFAVPGDYHEKTLADVEMVCRVRAAGEVEGVPVLIKPEANTCISCVKTLIPAVRYEITPGATSLETHVELVS